MAKINYLFWAARKVLIQSPACPYCRSKFYTTIRTKYLVTKLRECADCGLFLGATD